MTKWYRIRNGLWEARINSILWTCARMDSGEWQLYITIMCFHCGAPRRTLAACKALAEATEKLWEGGE